MNLLGIVLLLSSLLPIPAAVQDVGTVTFIEGSLRIIRGTTVLQATEGMRLRQGDILEGSEKGFAQLEFSGGAVVALGPSSRMYIFRHGAGGKSGSGAPGTELVLLSGWLKGQSDAHANSYRYESPALAGTTGNGTVVLHSNESGCEVFVEAGSAAIAEVSPNGSLGKPTDAFALMAREKLAGISGIMIEAAIAVRTYTATQIKPLLETQIKYSFLPQSVPAYSANSYFSQLQKKFPDYSYKEAPLNPTNPVNRATDWEADLVEEFRKSHDRKEIVGERDTPNGRTLYIARPMAVSSMACLSCHDTAEGAPRTMVERYGSANGFGWKLNDIVTAQIVSVPTQVVLQRAKYIFKTFMISLAAAFGILLLAINALLIFIVIRPVNRLSGMASSVSLGNSEISEFPVSGKDEISELAQSFNRMARSLLEAMKLLKV